MDRLSVMFHLTETETENRKLTRQNHRNRRSRRNYYITSTEFRIKLSKLKNTPNITKTLRILYPVTYLYFCSISMFYNTVAET